MTKYFFILFFAIFLTSCGVSSSNQRLQTAQDLILKTTNKQGQIKTSLFDLYFVKDINKSCKNLSVYIEGDGLSWVRKNRVSSNPTPINPLALKLYLEDNSKCKIYLARPCQYTNDKLCQSKFWTSHRFSNEVISSFDDAVTSIKKEHSIENFSLIGYSGGGAIATILSAARDDIKRLITVCGNLNHKLWTKKNRYTPLNGSLNPIDFTSKLGNISQIHLLGEKDTIIKKEIFDSYKSSFENPKRIEYIVYENFTHHKGWVQNWNKILENDLF